ncbi:MAG: glycosyltransferase family 4 protein [Planctomycetaceae bacterium]|nr:glycosyltransferase family 4 protein [Planctomycetaceae bacterium]
MRITYLTAGAAGMFCGSCMNDNAVARELIKAGHDCVLMPVYTPIRTDLEDMSVDRVFLGGVNVFLSQKIPLYRHLPRWMVGWLDHPWVIKSLTAKAGKTSPELLGELTLSMLGGLEGYQRQEFQDLLNFLQNNIRPDAIVLTNLLIGGVIPQMASNADVWVMLQGDDIFLDSLSASHRTKAVEKMRRLVGPTKGFICHSEAYAASMRELLGIPESKMHVVPLGVAISDFSTAALPGLDPSVSKENAAGTQDDSIHLGYLACMAPEKGLHRLVDAFIELKRNPQWKSLRLSMAGWMGPQHAAYWKEQQAKLRRSGLDGQWEYAGTLSRQQKVEYLSSLDLFCVPTEYADPKGIFLLEAVLAGVPYVMPSHGAFPELHRRIQEFHRQGVAGDLFRPDSQEDLVSKLQRALEQSPKRALPGPGLVSELDISTHAKRLLGLLQGKSVSL